MNEVVRDEKYLSEYLSQNERWSSDTFTQSESVRNCMSDGSLLLAKHCEVLQTMNYFRGTCSTMTKHMLNISSPHTSPPDEIQTVNQFQLARRFIDQAPPVEDSRFVCTEAAVLITVLT